MNLANGPLSSDTINKILKPLEGKQIDENDIQEVLADLLPKDEKVNDEGAKALVEALPTVKDAALLSDNHSCRRIAS